jgi:hypothetical protein
MAFSYCVEFDILIPLYYTRVASILRNSTQTYYRIEGKTIQRGGVSISHLFDELHPHSSIKDN